MKNFVKIKASRKRAVKEKKIKRNNRQRMFYEFLPEKSARMVIAEEMLFTWQPVAAIAERCGIPTKAVLEILKKMHADGCVVMARFRIDGHNMVHCFKKVDYVQVMGMRIAIEKEVEEL